MCSTSENQLKHIPQVVFLGIRGANVRNDIAIDKLSIVSGHCTGKATFSWFKLFPHRWNIRFTVRTCFERLHKKSVSGMCTLFHIVNAYDQLMLRSSSAAYKRYLTVNCLFLKRASHQCILKYMSRMTSIVLNADSCMICEQYIWG